MAGQAVLTPSVPPRPHWCETARFLEVHAPPVLPYTVVLSTWTEIFPQNPSRFHYHHGDDMKEASNPWKATWHHPPISETIQR